MVKEMEKESLASRRKKARLCTMYKISNDIVHINKSKNLTPATVYSIICFASFLNFTCVHWSSYLFINVFIYLFISQVYYWITFSGT